MFFEIGMYLYEVFVSLILDVRFVVLFVFAFLVHWAWPRTRPRKGARNKTVFITGCDTGMGHRMARRFDEMGMHVFAGCLNQGGEGAKSLKESCSSRLHIVQLDISKDDQVKEAVAYVKENLPPEEKGLYCLINNAGVMAYTYLDLMTVKMCEEIIAINLMGTIRVTKHFLPLILQAQGRVITITSIAARIAMARTAVYTATKHALNGFFSCLRYEVQDKGVHVATVEPGDFSRTTDIMQWTQRHLDDMWENLSPSERKEKQHLYDETKRHIHKPKLSASEQETNYTFLLEDVEDAMLAEEPYWRYVSAPSKMKLMLCIIRSLPEKNTF